MLERRRDLVPLLKLEGRRGLGPPGAKWEVGFEVRKEVRGWQPAGAIGRRGDGPLLERKRKHWLGPERRSRVASLLKKKSKRWLNHPLDLRGI